MVEDIHVTIADTSLYSLLLTHIFFHNCSQYNIFYYTYLWCNHLLENHSVFLIHSVISSSFINNLITYQLAFILARTWFTCQFQIIYLYIIILYIYCHAMQQNMKSVSINFFELYRRLSVNIDYIYILFIQKTVKC